MALLPSDPAQQRKLLLGVAPLLLAFAYGYFLHPERAAAVDAKSERLERIHAQNERARALSREAGPELEAKVAAYQEHIIRLEQLIPRTDEVAQLLNDMALRAHEADVELVRLAPNQAENGQFYTLERYEVSVAGAYHDVGRFLAAIGSLPRIVTPVEMRLARFRATGPRSDETRDGSAKVEASFKIETYVLPGYDEEVVSNGRT